MIELSILDDIGDAIYAVDSAWRFTFFNREAEAFFGCGREEVLGRNIWECFPAAYDTEVGEMLRAVMADRRPIHREVLSPTTGRWADSRMFPLSEGGVCSSWRDITDKKQQETALIDALENQDMLFRELAHRVTNNFQEVASRLTLQGRELHDTAAREMCEKMAVSIRCMALVNRRLYRSRERIDEQDLGLYVEALCEDLASTRPDHITLTSVVERGTKVATEVATTVGMMVAELVMNSRKYAWEPGQPGRMVVTLRRDGPMVEVELWDDGHGVPEGVDLTASAGLGLKLLSLQVRRLKGAFTQKNVEGGAIFLLRFPAPATPQRQPPPPERAAAASGLRP